MCLWQRALSCLCCRLFLFSIGVLDRGWLFFCAHMWHNSEKIADNQMHSIAVNFHRGLWQSNKKKNSISKRYEWMLCVNYITQNTIFYLRLTMATILFHNNGFYFPINLLLSAQHQHGIYLSRRSKHMQEKKKFKNHRVLFLIFFHSVIGFTHLCLACLLIEQSSGKK